MAKPTNKRGFRPIIVNDMSFNWRFSGKVDVRPKRFKENKLIIDFGWFDPIDFIVDPENRPPDFEPKIATPAFVSKAIQFALANNWDINKTHGEFYVKYRCGEFAHLTY